MDLDGNNDGESPSWRDDAYLWHYDEQSFIAGFKALLKSGFEYRKVLDVLTDLKTDNQRILFLTYCLRRFREKSPELWLSELIRQNGGPIDGPPLLSQLKQSIPENEEEELVYEAFSMTFEHAVNDFPRLVQRLHDQLFEIGEIHHFAQNVNSEKSTWFSILLNPSQQVHVFKKSEYGYDGEDKFCWIKGPKELAAVLHALRENGELPATSDYELAKIATGCFSFPDKPVNQQSLAALVGGARNKTSKPSDECLEFVLAQIEMRGGLVS
ncbi:MAG: hypothetical protein WBQ23_10025 [Bacteroidota bacterium]